MDDHSTSARQKTPGFWRRAFHLYADGFRNMSRTSRILWIIILVKLFIMFAILRLFFFPDVVKMMGGKDHQVTHVVEELTKDKDSEGEIPLWYDPAEKH